MRIDSGLSNFFYNNRFQHVDAQVEDATVATDASARPRTASNPSVSSTLLSSSLASALWTVEGGRRSGASQQAEDITRASSAKKVEASYLEYAMPVDEVH